AMYAWWPILSCQPAGVKPRLVLDGASAIRAAFARGREPGERRTMVDERVLRGWLDRIERGSLGRRAFTRVLLALGRALPRITDLLRSRGVADAQTHRDTFPPARRGGGGDLKLLWWQAPTILNPHLAIGVKDGDGSRLFYEPLVSFDAD